MAKFTFSAESDDLHEIATLVSKLSGGIPPVPVDVAENISRGSTAEEAAAEVKPAKAPKAKKGNAEAAAAATATETTTPTTTEAAAASEEPASSPPETDEVSQQDLHDAANAWLKKYPTGGPKLMDELEAKVGCRRLSAVPPEKRGEALALIQGLVP